MRACKQTLVLVVLVAAMMAGGSADAVKDDTILVSRAGGFGPKGNVGSDDPAFSADGRFVAFSSLARNLDPADTDTDVDFQDIFVRDPASDTTTLVSRANGASGAKSNSHSFTPSISADGRYVAFSSYASNLDPADADTNNGIEDIFVRDLVSNTNTLVSRASGETGAKGNFDSREPSISADGRFVTFQSFATNLVPADTDTNSDIFVRDLASDTTSLVSRASGETGAKGNAPSYEPSISADGRVVAFHSNATNLDPSDTDTNGYYGDVFVRDLASGATTLVSRASGATGANGDSSSVVPSISADGRFVAFFSDATNLDPADTNGLSDVFVRDRVSDSTTLVSLASGATGAKGNGNSRNPSISADGRFVAFYSNASNLDPADTDSTPDVFVRDLVSGTTTLVSRADGETGAKGNHESYRPSISADGRYVAFTSNASNLDPADTDDTADIFARDVLGPQAPPSLSINHVRKREGKNNTTTSFTFTVSLDGVPGRAVTVDFATKNRTATLADKDYRYTNGTLTFSPGRTTQPIVVTVNGDNKTEPSETFKVRLFNATGAEIEDPTGIGTITNDDG